MTKNTSSPDTLISLIIEGMEDIKGQNISLLDLRKIENTVCDYFIICDGNSNTQVNAIVNSVQKKVSKNIREKPYQIEGIDVGNYLAEATKSIKNNRKMINISENQIKRYLVSGEKIFVKNNELKMMKDQKYSTYTRDASRSGAS